MRPRRCKSVGSQVFANSELKNLSNTPHMNKLANGNRLCKVHRLDFRGCGLSSDTFQHDSLSVEIGYSTAEQKRHIEDSISAEFVSLSHPQLEYKVNFVSRHCNRAKMTQPSTLTQTFDTSLIDVQRSFSSTETDTSGSSTKENAPLTPLVHRREPSPYRTVPTDVLYSQWASTYDTDGNILQAADDIQLNDLLPLFVQLTNQNSRRSDVQAEAIRILDLGCGTGRNTVKLLRSNWNAEVDIVGWDGNQAMLELARSKCEAVLNEDRRNIGIELEEVDIASVDNIPAASVASFDGLISTLVLEHIPLKTYFSVMAEVLKVGCYALITNMHAELGAQSKAGYKTASGERFKATSYVYTVAETVEAANQAGFELVGSVREMTVDGRMFDGGVVNGVVVQKSQVAERARKWVGTKVWYGMLLRKVR